MLEAGRIAGNASGRNHGFVLPGFAESMERVVSRVGMEHAKALWDLSEMGLRYVRTTIAEARMPGVAPIAGWLKVSKVDNGDEVLADVQLYGQELGAEVEGWPTERVREVLKTDHYFHALHLPRAFHIHPLNYALGLAERGGSGRRAHLRAHNQRSRSMPKACASASPRRPPACVPAISSSPATSISPR